jgi:hypothetical protein
MEVKKGFTLRNPSPPERVTAERILNILSCYLGVAVEILPTSVVEGALDRLGDREVPAVEDEGVSLASALRAALQALVVHEFMGVDHEVQLPLQQLRLAVAQLPHLYQSFGERTTTERQLIYSLGKDWLPTPAYPSPEEVLSALEVARTGGCLTTGLFPWITLPTGLDFSRSFFFNEEGEVVWHGVFRFYGRVTSFPLGLEEDVPPRNERRALFEFLGKPCDARRKPAEIPTGVLLDALLINEEALPWLTATHTCRLRYPFDSLKEEYNEDGEPIGKKGVMFILLSSLASWLRTTR